MTLKTLLPPSEMNRLHTTPDVRPNDRVRTKSGRLGVVRRMRGNIDVAMVDWDDGESFPIRTCHLEVLARNWTIPAGTKAS